MPDDRGSSISGFLGKLLHRSEAVVADQEVVFVRGKVAGRTVTDAGGAVIVEAGQRVDEPIIQRAVTAGRLHALVGAVAAAQSQDLHEKVHEAAARTPEGRENRALESTADYAVARRYVGEITGLDVTDMRGSVVVPAGKEITEDDVRAARHAGLLSALVYSAQQPAAARGMDRAHADDPTTTRRTTLPMLHEPGQHESEERPK